MGPRKDIKHWLNFLKKFQGQDYLKKHFPGGLIVYKSRKISGAVPFLHLKIKVKI